MNQCIVDKCIRLYHLHGLNGNKLAKQHKYYDAMLEYEACCISLYPAYRVAHGMTDRRPIIKKNINLNLHCLKDVHVKSYELKPLFDDDVMYGTYFNVDTWWQILSDDLKHFSKLFDAVRDYEVAEHQNMFWNLNVGLRARYGCLGLTIFVDSYIERQKHIQHIQHLNKLAVMPLSKLLHYEQRSSQFNRN